MIQLIMQNNQPKCSLLPEAMGEKVVKINLDHPHDETARAILFVPARGFVREHSHAVEQNPDSEVYLDLLDIAQNGVKNLQHKPEVAGVNSPTGKLVHSIAANEQPQVYLAIKKSQKAQAWRELEADLPAYLHSLHFGCSILDKRLNIVSNGAKDRQEFVVIDFEKNQVNYLGESKDNKHNLQEEVTLDGLLNQQKDNGMEK